MEALKIVGLKYLITLPGVEWGRELLDAWVGDGVLSGTFIEERQMYKEARGDCILRKGMVDIEDHKVWSVVDRGIRRFYGLSRWAREVVGGGKTPNYGRYEIWSQFELQPNADMRTFTIFAADETDLCEAEWRNRKKFEEAIMEAVRRPAIYTTYVMEYLAGNKWTNPYWQGTDITHLF